MTTKNIELPLSGVRVVDLTIAMAGPLASQRLADMGADVIKVEAKGGDLTRVFELTGTRIGGETTSFLSLNRGKRSIVLDLKSAEGRAALIDLVKSADVFLQNFRPGVVERLGISYEDLQPDNPGLVYASISGYGESGPMYGAPGQDLLVQAFSGLMYNAGRKDDPPHPAPVFLIDAATSMLCTAGICAALYQKKVSGIGQHVRTSLLGAALEIQSQELMTYLATGRLAERADAPYASAWLAPPYGVYKTADGWVALPQADLEVIADVLGSKELAELAKISPSADDTDAVSRWREKVYGVLSDCFAVRESGPVVKELSAKKVWCGEVQNYEGLVNNPQSQDFFQDVEFPQGEKLKSVAPSISFGAGHREHPLPPPKLGADTDGILEEIGYDQNRIDALRATGALG